MNTLLEALWNNHFLKLCCLSLHTMFSLAAFNLIGYHNNGRSFLVQEFISNPFLIDNRKFSIGITVGFTSANPLRAYVLDSTMELRFCEKEYDAADLTDPASYVADGMEMYKIKFIEEVSLKSENCCNSNRRLYQLTSMLIK